MDTVSVMDAELFYLVSLLVVICIISNSFLYRLCCSESFVNRISFLWIGIISPIFIFNSPVFLKEGYEKWNVFGFQDLNSLNFVLAVCFTALGIITQLIDYFVRKKVEDIFSDEWMK